MEGWNAKCATENVYISHSGLNHLHCFKVIQIICILLILFQAVITEKFVLEQLLFAESRSCQGGNTAPKSRATPNVVILMSLDAKKPQKR